MSSSHQVRWLRRGAVPVLWLAACLCWVRADLPVETIHFAGDWPISTKRMSTAPEIEPGSQFDPALAQAGADRLMEACRTAYFPFARVRWRAEPNEAGTALRLTYTVDAGPRGTLEALAFEGNDALSDALLRRRAHLKPRPGWFARMTGRDVLLLEELAQDQASLLALYYEAGHMDAEIGSPDVAWIGLGRGFQLTWPIQHEGPVYHIGTIHAPSVARSVMQPFENQIATPARLHLMREQLRHFYLDQGHAFVSIQHEERWLEEAGLVDIFFEVEPGPVSVLRAIEVTGLTRTAERVVLREFPLRTGEPFDAYALALGVHGVAALDYFDDLSVDYVSVGEGDQFDVQVQVREKRTGRVEIGLLWGSVEGVAVQGVLRERNFSLRPPFRGAGYHADLTATGGPQIMRLQAGLRNPRVLDSRWMLSGSGFFEENRFISDLYDQRSAGGVILLSHPLGRYQVVGLGMRRSVFELRDVDDVLLGTLQDDDRNLDWAVLALTWSAERVDQRFRPTRGFRLRQEVRYGLSALGSDVEAVDWEARAAAYLNPFRKHVIVLRAETGHIASRKNDEPVPLPLRKFLGGPDNLRGFVYRSLAPLSEEGVALGGEAYWWAHAEYLMPELPHLDVALYYGVGTVSGEAWRFETDPLVSEWGIGAVIRAENFPVRFDVAFPLRVPEGDLENRAGRARFSFSAGYVF